MIRLKLFGAPLLQRDDGPLGPGAAPRRRLALLALLAAAGDDGMSRDKLVAYLWPDAAEEQARHTLAQTLYLLRRDLLGAEVVLGTSALRLNADAIRSDVAEFKAALSGGDVERAAAVYAGPFLDGFYLDDAEEFERWTDTERNRYATQARTAFERAARAAVARGDAHRAVEWWRRVQAVDPLDARATVGLMEALVAIGDRSGALKHAHVHQTLVREELDAPPDPAVRALAERLRSSPPAAATVSGADTPAPDVTRAPARRVPSETDEGVAKQARADGRPSEQPPLRRGSQWAIRGVVVAGVVLVVIFGVGARTILAHRTRTEPAAEPTYAVGAVRDYSGADTSGIARALTDMLATNLARVPDLHVVSNARIYELVGTGHSRANRDLAAQLSTAAREAGATEIIEGTMYRRGPGRLRFDLRRIDLATGAIRKAYSVEGADPFELVDRATAEVASDAGRGATSAGALHVADVTTRSFVAYRFYEEGLRSYYQQNDVPAARRLFLAAVAEDSMFAMAEFYAAECELALTIPSLDRFVHAARLAERATERERLLARGTLALLSGDPAGLAVAETLATRYPSEPDGHYLLGQALTSSGDFLGAVPHLRRVVEMDSLSLRGTTARCRACDALQLITTAYWFADSLAAAERAAREWTRQQPAAPIAWGNLAGMLLFEGRYDGARAASRRAGQLSPGAVDPFLEAFIGLRTGDFAQVDSVLQRHMRDEPASEARWFLTLSLRYQGRLEEALAVTRAAPTRAGAPASASPAPAPRGLDEAIVLFDMGRYSEAAGIFSSMAAQPEFRAEFPWRNARNRAWNLTHVATARAAAGDTAVLAQLADSIEHSGMLSAYGRDQRLHHYVRGLLLRARGDLPAAADELRRGIFSLTDGYTRNSYELARTLLLLDRAPEAIAVLQPAFSGSLQASNSYVTLTELHELLGQAFDAIGQADSAAAHYRYVVRAWAGADASFQARRTAAQRRLNALGRNVPR